MAQELFMVILIVRDIKASVAFYRALGLDLPEGVEEQPQVEIKMTGMSLLLTSQPRTFDMHYGERVELETGEVGSYPQMLEFDLKEHDAVDAMYAKLVGLGYRSYRAPYPLLSGRLRFAMIYDPDGNLVLISALAAES